MREINSIRLACAAAQEIKAGWMDEKSQQVLISRFTTRSNWLILIANLLQMLAVISTTRCI